jgi:hypothetical protein
LIADSRQNRELREPGSRRAIELNRIESRAPRARKEGNASIHEDSDSDGNSDILTTIQETVRFELLRRQGYTMTLKYLPTLLANKEGIVGT